MSPFEASKEEKEASREALRVRGVFRFTSKAESEKMYEQYNI